MSAIPGPVAGAVVVIAALVPVAGLDSVAFGGRAAHVARWGRLSVFVALGLLAWGATVCALDMVQLGWGAPYRLAPVAMFVAFLLPPMIGVVALRRAPRLRAALSHRSGLWRLASVQIARLLGAVFLLLHAQGKLPGLFAYPAAWEDIAIAVIAPIMMWAIVFREEQVRRRGSAWHRLFIAWNVLGITGHIVAVILGGTNYPGVTQLFHGQATTVMFATLPMVLFPVYMVPFADMLHLIMIDVVRHAPAAIATSEQSELLIGDDPGMGWTSLDASSRSHGR
jgi:hypothetical protein